MSRANWILNVQMMWGAVLGFLIFAGLGQINEAWHHQGQGYVTYEQPDRTERVSEHWYKRHQYTMGAMMLCIGLGLWVVIAKSAKDTVEQAGRGVPQGSDAGAEPR